ncbi:MAG: tRNA 2-selenouridine(34) synthase MnmH [Chromatiaceae bacterium]|jgi:tRNA 2-selenouridine synthase
MSPEDLPIIDDLHGLFLSGRPLLDVRAPVEFAEGAFPGAVNLPLIDDLERHEIGTVYAESGQAAAVELGEQLVGGPDRAARIARWEAYLRDHPDAVLYCFRGGMRSRISQRWLFEHAGLRCPRVQGGYKAMRRYLLEQLDTLSGRCKPVVIGGRTGVGKTRLLQRCAAKIDLEDYAHHRGSAFGHHPEPQPSQIDFENAVAVALLRQAYPDIRHFAVEDESRNIGSRHVPPALFERLQQSPLVLLEVDIGQRIATTVQEYVHDSLASFRIAVGEANAYGHWADYLRSALQRISRRLGGERYRAASRLLEQALMEHRSDPQTTAHREWIRFLLVEYYDGMYNYQLEHKRDRIVFRGTQDEVLDYLHKTYGIETAVPTV